MTVTALRDSDLHAMFTLVEDARHDEPGDIVPWALLQGLSALIEADSVQLCELDWHHEQLVQWQYIDEEGRGAITSPTRGDYIDLYFRTHRDFLPCGDVALGERIRPDLSRQAIRFSDFYTDREFRGTPAWSEYYNVDGCVRTCLSVRLPGPPGHARRVLFMRSSPTDFTDRDVMLLTLLRPHMHEIYLDAARRRGGAPKLTAREWEILQLAGEGLSNAAIGQRLFISVATVRKHMEHIFDTLGVRTRAQAAAIALPHRANMPGGQ